MNEKYVDITSLFVDEAESGRFYLSTKIVKEMKLRNGDHFKVFVNGSKITFEKVE